MKKWKLLAGLTLLLLLLLSVTAQADSSSYGVVFGAANVNLRSAPTTSSAVLGAYNKGTWMTVRGYSNGFYQAAMAGCGRITCSFRRMQPAQSATSPMRAT